MRGKLLSAVLGAVLIIGFTAMSARAAILSFPMTIEFSGATPPAGAGPWLTATFDDGGGTGSVTLDLIASNLVSQEFVFNFYFNLDPSLDPNSLVFSAPTKTGAFADPTISKGINAFQADGDGLYDVKVDFANGGGANNRFGVGEAVRYTITGIPTLTAASFNYLSAPAGGNGPFHVAAHVGGIGASGNNSGWVTFVPEPSSAAVVISLAGIGLVRRRTR